MILVHVHAYFTKVYQYGKSFSCIVASSQQRWYETCRKSLSLIWTLCGNVFQEFGGRSASMFAESNKQEAAAEGFSSSVTPAAGAVVEQLIEWNQEQVDVVMQ